MPQKKPTYTADTRQRICDFIDNELAGLAPEERRWRMTPIAKQMEVAAMELRIRFRVEREAAQRGWAPARVEEELQEELAKREGDRGVFYRFAWASQELFEVVFRDSRAAESLYREDVEARLPHLRDLSQYLRRAYGKRKKSEGE